jgi:hypothetical protein
MVCGSHLVHGCASRAELGLEFALHMADTAMARIFNQVDHRTLLRRDTAYRRFARPSPCKPDLQIGPRVSPADRAVAFFLAIPGSLPPGVERYFQETGQEKAKEATQHSRRQRPHQPTGEAGPGPDRQCQPAQDRSNGGGAQANYKNHPT